MQIATPAIYRQFLTEKTPQNTKFVEKQSNLAWCHNLVTQATGKTRVISRMSTKKTDENHERNKVETKEKLQEKTRSLTTKKNVNQAC